MVKIGEKPIKISTCEGRKLENVERYLLVKVTSRETAKDIFLRGSQVGKPGKISTCEGRRLGS